MFNDQLMDHLPDPLVGRDLLIGSIVGTFWVVAEAFDLMLPRALGRVQGLPAIDSWALSGLHSGRDLLGNLLDGTVSAVYQAVFFLLTFALLPWSRTTESGPADKDVVESVALFAAAVESVSADDPDESDELWTVGAALEDMEDQWVVPADSWFEEEVGDLEDDIDRLLSDTAAASDV